MIGKREIKPGSFEPAASDLTTELLISQSKSVPERTYACLLGIHNYICKFLAIYISMSKSTLVWISMSLSMLIFKLRCVRYGFSV